MVAQLFHQGGEVAPEESPWLRGAGARHHGRIEPVEVDGEIEGLAAQGPQGFGQALDGDESAGLAQFAELLTGAAADRDLQQLLAGQHLQAAAHGAGMAVVGAEPLLAQVGVGIELHEYQVGMLRSHGGHGARTDRVFAAEHQRLEPQAQHRFGGPFHRRHHRFRRAKGDVDGPQIRHRQLLQVAVQLRAIALQASAHLADGRRPEAGAGPEGGGAVVGHTEQAYATAGGVALAAHVDGAVAVKEMVHGFRARSMPAGMASKAPRCQRGLQISQPAATAAARLGSGCR